MIETDSDTSKLHDYIANGTYRLFLISSDANWKLYCKPSYCRALPQDLADEDSYFVKIPGNVLFQETKMGLIDFYACIQKNVTDAEYDAMVTLLRKLKAMS